MSVLPRKRTFVSAFEMFAFARGLNFSWHRLNGLIKDATQLIQYGLRHPFQFPLSRLPHEGSR